MDICPVCGETDMRPYGWRQCPACTHPYPPEEPAPIEPGPLDEELDEDELDEDELDEDNPEDDAAFFDDVEW